MSESLKRTADILAAVPSQEEIKRRLADNIRERQLLRQTLRLVQQRDKEVSPCRQ